MSCRKKALLEMKTQEAFNKSDRYMKQNGLIWNKGKTKRTVFKNINCELFKTPIYQKKSRSYLCEKIDKDL